MNKFISHSAQETIDFGKKLSIQLRGGEVICLYGNLGAGKTTLIKGIGLGLGVKKIITSPTFVLMNVYKIKNPKSEIRNPKQIQNSKSKIRSLVHIDCYRIKDEREIINIGAQEYFGRKNTAVVIEWAEKIKKILLNLPKKRIDIKIKILNKNERRMSMSFN